jgi:KaiC/GvpD/RAD55 family RecA-like ATPase
MPGKEVAVTDFQKKDNGSGKEVEISFQNQSDDLFYDFVNFYSGKKNLDTELLDLKPGEVKNITVKASDLEGRLKISKDSFNSGVIFREGEDATEDELVPDRQQEKDTDNETREARPSGVEESEKGDEDEGGNLFERAMEGEAEPPHLDKLSSEVPDLSETVKEMKEKTLENDQDENDKVEKRSLLDALRHPFTHPGENTSPEDRTQEEGSQDVEKENPAGNKEDEDGEGKNPDADEMPETPDDEADEQEKPETNVEASKGKAVEKRSLVDALIHPFTHPQPKDNVEQGVEESETVEASEEEDEASDPDEEDMLVTEKNNYSTDRVTTGVINLDNKIEGGFVKGTMNLITGKTGTGKTAFCSNFILEGARKGEPGVYVTTEEREEDILEDINSMFGWDFDSLSEQDKVRVLSIKPVFPSQNMDNISRIVRSYISDLLDQVNDAIEEIGAERVVIDSVSLVQMFIQDEYMSRVALSSLMNNLREAGVTAVLVGSIPETSEGLSKEGIIEYLVDTVILLEFVPVAEDYNRTLKIRKMRRTDHETDIFPFEVTADGLELHEAYESI